MKIFLKNRDIEALNLNRLRGTWVRSLSATSFSFRSPQYQVRFHEIFEHFQKYPIIDITYTPKGT